MDNNLFKRLKGIIDYLYFDNIHHYADAVKIQKGLAKKGIVRTVPDVHKDINKLITMNWLYHADLRVRQIPDDKMGLINEGKSEEEKTRIIEKELNRSYRDTLGRFQELNTKELLLTISLTAAVLTLFGNIFNNAYIVIISGTIAICALVLEFIKIINSK